jgi:DNA-binding transcriptional ArsR family regulator
MTKSLFMQFILYFYYNGNMEAKITNSMIQEADAVKALAALAQAQRLRVFRALVQAGRAGLTPGVMAAMLDVPASSLSFHLKELSHAGLAQVEQQGRSLIYRADFSRMNGLLAFLTQNCCAADPEGGCC